MNKFLKYTALSLASAMLAACVKEIDPEPIRVQKPVDLGDAYYARLREYKKSKHQIAFGWFGRWTAQGPSGQKFLSSAPDSMDIISIWGQYHTLTPAQIEDLRYVQQVKGTRVTFTVFSHNMSNLVGDKLENTAENIPAAAKMLADTILKYGYDGIDFDHECSSGDLLYNKENMTTLLREMRALLGPDKLIMVDGHVNYITEEGWQYADYAVQQAYGSATGTQWTNVKKYITPDRFILTENFENYWSGGGKLLQQAAWNPAEGIKGGCGTYHMEYEYAHSDVPYKWIRQAIQIMNPAQNEIVWTETGPTEKIVRSTSGKLLSGGGEIAVDARIFRPVPGGAEFAVTLDAEAVADYNEANGTELRPLPARHISYPTSVRFSGDGYFAEKGEPVRILAPEEIDEGNYLAPLRIETGGHKEVKAGKDAVLWLRVDVTVGHIQMSLSRRGEQEVAVATYPSGEVSRKDYTLSNVTLSLDYAATTELAIELRHDPAYVTLYNETHGTSYRTPDDIRPEVSDILRIETGATKSSAANITLSGLDRLADGEWLFAMRPTITDPELYACADDQTIYLHITKEMANVKASYSAPGTALPTEGWTCTVLHEGQEIDLTDKIFDGDRKTDAARMDGDLQVTVGMDAAHTLTGFSNGVSSSSYRVESLEQVETSLDGISWIRQGSSIKASTAMSNWQYFQFVEPVECRFIRFVYGGSRSTISEFAAYEKK